MSNSNFTFNSSYISSTLIPALEEVVAATELGGNTELIDQFSLAGGKSSYSFGLYQFDIGVNPGARELLLSFGFSSSQITELGSSSVLPANTLAALTGR